MTGTFYEADTKPTVNPRTLVGKSPPYYSRLQPALSNTNLMWTTEYQRQFTWKSSIPSSHKVDSSTATTDQRVYRTAIASPRHTTMLRDDSAQTAPLLSSKSAQTTVPSTIIRLKETDTQTILSQPLVSVSTQSSPVAPVEMTSLPMEDRVAQYSPPHIPRRTEVLFDLERTKLPAAGLPSDYFVKGEAHLPQILSYGWANESPFVPALDHKTFNVKITPQETVPHTKDRGERMREYELGRLEKQRRKAGMLRDYLRTRSRFEQPREPATAAFETEYSHEFRAPPRSVYSHPQANHHHQQHLQSSPSSARIIHPMETDETIKRRIPTTDAGYYGPAAAKRNRYSWLDLSGKDQFSQFPDDPTGEVDGRRKSVSFASQT